MIFNLFAKDRDHNLATLITRTVFTVMAVVTLFVLFQNYQATSKTIAQEVERTKQQTSSLVQALFKFQLSSLQIQQDSYGRNSMLIQSLRDNSTIQLDQFFASVDEIDPQISPDVRYITTQEEVFWDDASYTFFGVEEASLKSISQSLTRSGNWHLTQTSSLLGNQFLLIRRTPIVDPETGEVLGMYHIGIVLNRNLSLMESLRSGSNSESAVMIAGSDVISSTIREHQLPYDDNDVLKNFSQSIVSNKYIVGKTTLVVSGNPTYVSIYTVQSNPSSVDFNEHYNLWAAILIIFMFFMGGVSRYWLNKRVSSELEKLMQYTSDTVEKRHIDVFKGSPITEFDQIGHTLEYTFKRLTEQEKQFEDLFNFSLSPIIFWSVEGQVIKMNPAGQKYFNAYREHDETYHLLVDRLLPKIKMAAQGATLTGVNIPIADKVFRWNLSPIIVDEEVQLIIAQSQDITSLIAAEKQSELARIEAEELAGVRADFLAKMSHELRTPLNGILGVSQLLRDGAIDSKMLENVNVLCNSGEHLLAVLNDILDFSKLEQGKYSIQHSQFSPIETYQTVDKIFSPLCHEKGIEFIMETDFSEEAVISTDKVRLTQILFNLVSNGVKFTHHGQVKVSFTHTNDGDASYLHFTVSDTGIGIEEAYIERVFEPFVQASESTSREYGGSGLGLTIIKNLVELLDGKYEITSEFGIGTSFTVHLPILCIESNVVTNVATVSIPPESLFDSELDVLLVEDNHTNAFIARAFCEKFGMKITWVQDGQSAIDEVKNRSFDLVLMDNQLPKLSGVEATRIIREELKSEVPIFACTADGMPGTKQEFLDVGANYIIIKPIKENELYQSFEYLKEEHLQ